ncbi:hypothetical protein ACL02T_32200 [Pseudonocardia sp. RS010]|uniref:hypothetical protein n=1 Tax=Pseudonocardia sp. RS010 TaxID=3385979 RepID=UPI0039A29182
MSDSPSRTVAYDPRLWAGDQRPPGARRCLAGPAGRPHYFHPTPDLLAATGDPFACSPSCADHRFRPVPDEVVTRG